MLEFLWLPEALPPQVDMEASADLKGRIEQKGAIEVAFGAFRELETTQQRLCSYLDVLGFDLNLASRDGSWPIIALRLGAALAYLGYKHSEQSVSVDSTLDLSVEMASIQGIPEAYATSMYSDQGLQDVIIKALEDERLKPGNDPGIMQISVIGAGCVRFHMQEAILAQAA